MATPFIKIGAFIADIFGNQYCHFSINFQSILHILEFAPQNFSNVDNYLKCLYYHVMKYICREGRGVSCDWSCLGAVWSLYSLYRLYRPLLCRLSQSPGFLKKKNNIITFRYYIIYISLHLGKIGAKPNSVNTNLSQNIDPCGCVFPP